MSIQITMLQRISQFQKGLYLVLLGLLGLVIVASVLDLAFIVITSLLDAPFPLLEHREILSIFSLFLLVLIGIEFFETILAFLHENVIHVEIIIMVAVIAAARKVIILDTHETGDLHLIGLSLLIVSLGVSYYLIRRSNVQFPFRR